MEKGSLLAFFLFGKKYKEWGYLRFTYYERSVLKLFMVRSGVSVNRLWYYEEESYFVHGVYRNVRGVYL